MSSSIEDVSERFDLDLWAAAFEEAWQSDHTVRITDFLPESNHSHFVQILCELVCIEMELSWSHGEARALQHYRDVFPELFEDKACFQQIAFEEYRQRVQAGLPVSPKEYMDRFGIDVSKWPQIEGEERSTKPTQHVEVPRLFPKGPLTAIVRSKELEHLGRTTPRTLERLRRAADQMPRAGDRFIGFNLLQVLGRGTFGSVFLARQSELADRPVALKVSAELRDEPQKLARLQHTNIVPIYSVHQIGVLQAVCMPFLGSTTLAHIVEMLGEAGGWLPATGRAILTTLHNRKQVTVHESSKRVASAMPTEDGLGLATPILEMMQRMSHIEAVLWIMARTAEGLAHAHERGILHRDLKPANILLTDEGQPMLLDFNLAYDANEPDTIEHAHLGGTLPYMAPEQIEACLGNDQLVDERSDLYSLGVIFFELLTGHAPFTPPCGMLEIAALPMLQERRHGAPSARKINSAIPAAVDAIVRKILAPEPSQRYANAGQLREDLERQLSHRPLKHAPDHSLSERLHKWRRRNPRLATASFVLAVVVLFAVLPATLIALKQNNNAARDRELADRTQKLQVETAEQLLQAQIAEAKQIAGAAASEARNVQMMLATQTNDRALLNQALVNGRAVLAQYGVDFGSDWMQRPRFAALPSNQQMELRYELAEMLLLMARGEQIHAGDSADPVARDSGYRTAIKLNRLAETVYLPDRRPRALARQRTELLKLLPAAVKETPPLTIDKQTLELDAYHEGVALAIAGRYRDAVALLRPFTDRHPRSFQAWYVRGVCHNRLGQFADSTASFSVCIALEPEMRWVWFTRGVARLHQSDYTGAEADLTQSLQLLPDWPAARLDRALARKGKKDFEGALADLDLVLENPTAQVRAWFLRAQVKELKGDRAGAAIDRAEGMKRVPADEVSWNARGYARMSQDPEAALKDFDEAIALNPRSREALLNKSIVLSETLRRPKEAVEVLDRLLHYYPDFTMARAGRGVVLARIGECKRARDDAQECLGRERTPFLLYQMAGLYAQTSRHEPSSDAKREALRLLESALKSGFSDSQTLLTDSDLDPIRDDAEFKRLVDVANRFIRSPKK